MTSGVSGFGTVLVWNYHKILELSNIGGVSQTRATIDVTSHDSPDSYKEYAAGLGDGGEIPISGNFISGDTNGQIAFHTAMQAVTKRYAYIVFPMAQGGSLEAWMIASGFDMSFPMDDKLGISGSLKITGKPLMYLTQSTGLGDLDGEEEESGASLDITPDIAVDTYAYICTVDTLSSHVHLTITAGSHTIYAQGTSQTTAQLGGEIALGDPGTDTVIFIMVYESEKSPRLYKLTVSREAAS